MGDQVSSQKPEVRVEGPYIVRQCHEWFLVSISPTLSNDSCDY